MFYKKCEKCGKKINKFQRAWNLFSAELSLKCKNCKSEYRSSKIPTLIYAFLFHWLFDFPIVSVAMFLYFYLLIYLEECKIIKMDAFKMYIIPFY